MSKTSDSVTAIHDLITTAARSRATPLEAMQLTQAALNAANALAAVTRLPPDPTSPSQQA